MKKTLCYQYYWLFALLCLTSQHDFLGPVTTTQVHAFVLSTPSTKPPRAMQPQRRLTPTWTTTTTGRTASSPTPLRNKNALQETTSSSSEPVSSPELDVQAVGKYVLAIGVQMSLFYSIFRGVDYLVNLAGVKVPFALNCVVFWFTALKSRVLNPMDNSRPQMENLETNTTKRKMPSWTPPGVVFPIMWLLIIAPLRAVTTAMVYRATGSYCHPAVLSLMLHLSIGDVWNSINNIERRYGASVVGVLMVWLSKAHAAYRYGQVVPLAGKLLCIPLVWLTIASALITRTWQLNPDPTTGRVYPLYPAKGQGVTKFKWFHSKE